MDIRYQCPQCERSYIENKGRFCEQFTEEVKGEEREKAEFVFVYFGFYLTRECKLVYRGWNWNCAGFRE